MIVVGSKALEYWSGKPSSKHSDTDAWILEGHKEFAHWPEGSTEGWDISVMPEEVYYLFSEESFRTGYATLEDQLAIKLSHMPYDILWHKHKQYTLLLAKLTDRQYNEDLYGLLKRHWKEVHGGSKSHLSLYKTKCEFFEDFVPKQHEHDYLHELVAFPDKPIYTECLKDGHEVMIDNWKWKGLHLCRKIRMMREEVAVIALERWLIPTLSKGQRKFTIQEAWNKSLHKVVTQLTKNEFSEFIVLHLNQFLRPLTEEMLYALEQINLKEIYMTGRIDIDTFKEMVEGVVCKDGEPKYGFYFDEILMEGAEEQGIDLIEQEGGGEGGSEYCYSVLKIDGVFYKVTYSYYSHHGFDTQYAEVWIVTPKEKTVTVFE